MVRVRAIVESDSISQGALWAFDPQKAAKNAVGCTNRGTIHFVEHSALVTLGPTMKTFENKTVLITGGASGIGKATAIAFGKEGANVVVSAAALLRESRSPGKSLQPAEVPCMCRPMSDVSRYYCARRKDRRRLRGAARRVQQRRHRGPVRPAHHRADGRALPSGLRCQHPRRVAVDEARDPGHASVRWWSHRE